MKKFWMALLIVALLGGCRRLEPAPTPVVQAACPGGLQSLAMLEAYRPDLQGLADIPAYTIRLELSEPFEELSARASLIYTNTTSVQLDDLYFHLLPNGGKSYGDGWLRVDRLWMDGSLVEFNLLKGDEILQLPLEPPLPPGGRVELAFDYRMKIPQDFGGESGGAYGILNHADGVLVLSGWYPMLAVYDEDGWNLDRVSSIGDSVYAGMSSFQVELTLPDGYRFASTGVEAGRPAGGPVRCLASGPVREFVILVSPDFQVLSQDVDGVRVNAYHLPGHAVGGQAALEIAARSLEIYNRRFGPYPYAELDVVETPLRNALGVEFPGTVLIASNLYADPKDDSFIVATAHEVAHQWWYNLVGNDVFDEPWLDEGLTTFSSALYYEDAFGPGGYAGLAEYWRSRYGSLVEDGDDRAVTLPLAYFEGMGNPRVYGTVVYSKAALFFVQVRQKMGDETFFAALQEYFNQYRYGIAAGDDLLQILVGHGGEPVQRMIEDWLGEP